MTKRNKILFFITLLFSGSASALTHALECNNQGKLVKYTTISSESDQGICEGTFKALGRDCFDMAGKSSPDELKILSPLSSYYSNRSSTYDSRKVQGLIESAVKNNQDPYLALGTVLIENPATLKDPEKEKATNFWGELFSDLYESTYGEIPLDEVAVIDAMGCGSQKFPHTGWSVNQGVALVIKDFPGNKDLFQQLVSLERSDPEKSDAAPERRAIVEKMITNAEAAVASDPKDANNDQSVNFRKLAIAKDAFKGIYSPFGMILPRKGPQPTVHLGKGSKYEVCLPHEMTHPGASGKLWIRDLLNSSEVKKGRGCCLFVQHNLKDKQEVIKETRKYLAFKYLSFRYEAGKRIASKMNVTEPGLKMATVLQAYNGYGLLGRTKSGGEKTNKCLTGLNTKTSPLYGAGKADIVTNTLMMNSQIRKLVDKASQGRPVSSIFCQTLGSGKHEFKPTDFPEMQKKFLSGRNCPRHSYDYLQGTEAEKKRGTL